MPRKKTTNLAAVPFTKTTRTASYGDNAQSNTQSNTQSQSNSPNSTPDPTPNPDPFDSQLDSQLVDSNQHAKKQRKANLIWTDKMEETLFSELLGQGHLGKRADMGFKSEAWTVVRDAVQEVYTGSLVIEVLQLKSKESNYKVLYKDWKWLKDQSGFGRDPDTGAITACLQAWNDVIKVPFYYFYIHIYL
jgi:hypothetical protein